MPPLKTYDIFISHAWTYNADYYKLVSFLGQARNFKWRNYSVPSHDPADANSTRKLEEALRRQMRPANAILIISGMYAAYRDWIQFEIDYAEELAKPIIGIQPWGAKRTPRVVSDAANVMVGWQTSSIVDAIRAHSL